MKQEQGEKLSLIEASRKSDYDQLHIKSAIHLPDFDFEMEARKAIPSRGTELVVYAANASRDDAWEMAQKLDQLGFPQIYLYRAGKAEWVRQGLPTEGMHLPPDGILREAS